MDRAIPVMPSQLLQSALPVSELSMPQDLGYLPAGAVGGGVAEEPGLPAGPEGPGSPDGPEGPGAPDGPEGPGAAGGAGVAGGAAAPGGPCGPGVFTVGCCSTTVVVWFGVHQAK